VPNAFRHSFCLKTQPFKKIKSEGKKTKRNKKQEFFQKTKGVLPENGGEAQSI